MIVPVEEAEEAEETEEESSSTTISVSKESVSSFSAAISICETGGMGAGYLASFTFPKAALCKSLMLNRFEL